MKEAGAFHPCRDSGNSGHSSFLGHSVLRALPAPSSVTLTAGAEGPCPPESYADPHPHVTVGGGDSVSRGQPHERDCARIKEAQTCPAGVARWLSIDL